MFKLKMKKELLLLLLYCDIIFILLFLNDKINIMYSILMNIKGNTSININSLEDIGKINLSNLEYELNLKAKNMGFLSKKEKEQQKNGLSLNSLLKDTCEKFLIFK